MSTKTTIKRIALVAVSALGLGMVSGVATAAPTTQTYTASLVPNTTSITRVTSNTDATGAAIFKLRAYDESGASTALFGLESITVSVYAVPAIDTKTVALNAADIAYAGVKATSQTAGTYEPETSANLVTNGGNLTITNAATEGNSYDSADGSTADVNGTYFLAVYPTADALNKGYYTLRLRLQNQSGFITDQYIKVQFVTSAADSGAVITLTKSGTITTGAALAVTTDNKITATVKDANGGLIQTDRAAGAAAYDISAPVLNAQIRNSSTLVVSDTLTASDNGTAATNGNAADHVAPTDSDAVSAVAALSYMDGTYGLTKSSALAADDTSAYNQVRAWYGSKEALLALTVANAPAGSSTGVTFVGVGNLAASTPFALPITTKTASFKVSGATAGKAYYYSVVWTKCGAGDQTPLDATPTTVYADAAGYISIPVTCANPVDGSSAAVTITGFTTGNNPAAQTINWVKSKATNISVDLGGATVALKSTNVFTATVTDAFGAPVADFVLQPALSSTSSNYAAATVYPTVKTDAKGAATFSLTDASAIAAGTDTVSFTATDGTSFTAGTNSATIKYAATAPAATALAVYYSPTPSTTSTDAAVVTAVPTSGIYVNGTSTKFQVQKDTNFGLSISAADSKDQVKMRVSAAVAGVKVTATGSAGVYFLNAAGFAVSTLSKYTGTTGYTTSWVVGSTKAGANTVTFTSGTVTQTASFWSETGAGNARFVKLAQDATTGAVTATVTDRYGNGISNVNVQLSTSAGTLGNGQLTAVFATNLDGAVSVLPAGAEEAVITATLTDTTANDTAAAAGYSSTTVIDSSVAAGNKTATLTIKPVVSATDSATAAQDAANEATDAANAATDAANAAAEAADAATAAAQDAQAAVAALATEVAAMISGIKAQIIRLTNLVVKIQKKVNA